MNQKGQHAVLFGERGVGKTSLANVLSAYIGGSIVVTQQQYEQLNASNLLSNTVTAESVRRALTVISQGVVPILIIDEFDRLGRDVKRQMADTIKTLSDHAVGVTVILVGVADSVDELIDEHESVERAIQQVPMPRMTTHEVSEIISSGLGRLNFQIAPEALGRIVTLAQGLPHYAHLLGLHAAEIAFRVGKTVISLPMVDEAITVAITGAQQSIKTLWHAATTSPRKDNLLAEVLMACALASTDDLGYFAAQDVRDPLRSILKRPVEIANYAQHLADFCGPKKGPVLQRRGEARKYRFRFINPLFQPHVLMQGFANSKIPH